MAIWYSLFPIYPRGNVLQTKVQFHRQETDLDLVQVFPAFHVLMCVHLLLCGFITWKFGYLSPQSRCPQHHSVPGRIPCVVLFQPHTPPTHCHFILILIFRPALHWLRRLLQICCLRLRHLLPVWAALRPLAFATLEAILSPGKEREAFAVGETHSDSRRCSSFTVRPWESDPYIAVPQFPDQYDGTTVPASGVWGDHSVK